MKLQAGLRRQSVEMVKLMLYGSTEALLCLRFVLIRIDTICGRRRPKHTVVRAVSLLQCPADALWQDNTSPGRRDLAASRAPLAVSALASPTASASRGGRLNQFLKSAVVRVQGNLQHMGLQLWPCFMRFLRPFCNTLLGLGPLLHAQGRMRPETRV